MSSQEQTNDAEISWIQKYSKESHSEKENKKEEMKLLFLTMPFLRPFSDHFVRFCALAEPKIEDEFEKIVDGELPLPLVESAICIKEIKACRTRSATEALAKRSHLKLLN